jgi:hypothetical protein
MSLRIYLDRYSLTPREEEVEIAWVDDDLVAAQIVNHPYPLAIAESCQISEANLIGADLTFKAQRRTDVRRRSPHAVVRRLGYRAGTRPKSRRPADDMGGSVEEPPSDTPIPLRGVT